MRYTLALSMIPVVVAWVVTPKPAPVIVAKAVEVEGFTARRSDLESSFRMRWAQAIDMPPTVEVRHEDVASSVEAPVLVPPSPPASRLLGAARSDERQTVGATVSARPRQIRTAALRGDICARHNMRRVNYGRRWRCRR